VEDEPLCDYLKNALDDETDGEYQAYFIKQDILCFAIVPVIVVVHGQGHGV
jgi:hypothetical protein